MFAAAKLLIFFQFSHVVSLKLCNFAGMNEETRIHIKAEALRHMPDKMLVGTFNRLCEQSEDARNTTKELRRLSKMVLLQAVNLILIGLAFIIAILSTRQ